MKKRSAFVTYETQFSPCGGITAVMKQHRVFGPNLELRRTISSTLGEPTLRVHDVVTNVGNAKTPHMLLYHCNYGWPLADEGTKIVWKGQCQSRGLDMDNAIFNDQHDFRTCCKPLARHKAVFTATGRMNISKASFARDERPIEQDCTCYTCQNFSRAYLRHLIVAKEMLAGTLLSVHNLHTLLKLARDMRQAILDGQFSEFSEGVLNKLETP